MGISKCHARLILDRMTWALRLVSACLALGWAFAAQGQSVHWSHLLRAQGTTQAKSLEDIQVAYREQHEDTERLRGTGLKQLERWTHWQAMRGGQAERVPAAAWWLESSGCLLYTSPSPRDVEESRMPSSA